MKDQNNMSEEMKFRDPALAKKVTHYGLRALLPETVDVIAGPGCPVCVLPAAEIDEAIFLALKGVTVVTFGDLLRVPGSETSLQEARASGGDVRIVYGLGDAVKRTRILCFLPLDLKPQHRLLPLKS
jgi:hydrogenase expression/formation protein HypD